MKRLALVIVCVLIGGPADARRHSERWYLAHGYHRGPVKGFVKDQPSPKPAAENAPAAVLDVRHEPPLRLIRPIVNGAMAQPWSGPPPSWAGALYVSPMLSGRSASARQ